MKPSEFKKLSAEELNKKIAELKEQLFNLRFQLATGQLQNTMQIKDLKRDIARAMTELTIKSKE